MGDSMSGGSSGGPASSLGLGLINYLSAIQANKNARMLNATSDKWAPLLALNKSQGKADIEVPTASFAKIMGPAMVSAMQSPMSSGGGGGGGGQESQIMAGGQGESGGGNPMDLISGMGGSMMAAKGGTVPKYGGGGIMGMLDPAGLMGGGGGGGGGGKSGGSSIMSLLPMLAMLAAKGGMVPGTEEVPGDSLKNDKYPVMASAGEGIVPKSVMKNPSPTKLSHFIHAVKKNGPGPLPVNGKKPMATSMSPWAALCSGGMVR